MPTAIITGATGQDGLYMAELLFSKGYRVIGAIRDVSNSSDKIPRSLLSKIELIQWDMRDQRSISEIFRVYAPKEIYNYSAYSTGSGMYNDPVEMGDVNGLAISRILESIREVDNSIRFCQASSSEMFGETEETPQTEKTAFHPRSPYGAAKLYAHSMINIYRKRYGIFACSAILFNHESPRRGFEFVTRKITREVAKIKRGLSSTLSLGNLDARRDWGFAGDYVRAMWLMLQAELPDDYVIATGEVHSVRELCEIAFNHVGLDYKDYVVEDLKSYRPLEEIQLVGVSDKARKVLRWEPEINFHQLICMMVDGDLQHIDESQGES